MAFKILTWVAEPSNKSGKRKLQKELEVSGSLGSALTQLRPVLERNEGVIREIRIIRVDS